jgi:plastocyanin
LGTRPPLAVLVTAALAAACSSAGPDPTGNDVTLTVVAEELRFTPARLTAPVDEPFVIVLDNRDRGIPHNVSIYRDEDADEPILVSIVSIGEARTIERVDALPVGTYFVRCDIHRTDMTGTLDVR